MNVSRKLKNIGIVSLLTVVSRVLGLVRDQLGAAIFGASLLNDAFLTAFNLPNLFRRLLGEGSLTAAFVPTLQEELQENGLSGAFALLSKVTSWLVVVTGGLVVVGMTLLSQSRAYPGLQEKWYLAADLSVIIFPYMALVCLAAAFSATLNVLQRFVEPALSPIWLNLTMIVSLAGAGWNLAHTDLGRMHWQCAGVLLGGFLQMGVPAAVLVWQGWRPRFDLSVSPRIREIARLMAPGLFGTAIYQINIFVSRLLAFSLTESAASVLFYSNRLMELPIGVFAIAVSTVVYPLIAKHAAARDFRSMSDDYLKGIRLILMINVPAAVGLVLLSEPIVRLLFQHGRFSASDTHLMAPLLAVFATGMPFFSVVSLTTRAFYAVKDTATPVKIAALSFVVNIGLSLLLMPHFGVTGLVLASTAGIVLQTFLLQYLLARKLPEMHLRPLWPSIWKVLLASVLLAVAVRGGLFAVRAVWPTARAGDLVAIAGLIPAGVTVYAAGLWLLRIEGREEFSELWQKLLRRKSPVKPV